MDNILGVQVLRRPAHRLRCLCIALMTLCPGFLAAADGPSALARCPAIGLRLSDGWWLAIHADGSGSYGFGALAARVRVRRNTFSYPQVTARIESSASTAPANAEAPYVAVTCRTSGTAREHRLAQDRQWLADLFSAARDGALPPANEIEKLEHERVEALFNSRPLL